MLNSFGNTALDLVIEKIVKSFGYKKSLEITILQTLESYHVYFPKLKEHSEYIAFMGQCVASKLGFDNKKEFAFNLLHDIGKLRDLDFFLKLGEYTTKPSPAEYERIKLHSLYGYQMLMEKGHLFCAHGAAWHHKFRFIDPYGPEVEDISEFLPEDVIKELKVSCWRLGIYDFIDAFMNRESENVHSLVLLLNPYDKYEQLKFALETMYGKDEVVDVAWQVCLEFMPELKKWSQ